MTLEERLQLLIAGLPADGSALLSRRSVEEWLADAADGHLRDAGTDLSVEDVALRVGKSCNTVRRWCLAGHLRAYRPGNRDWRIRPEDLDAFRRGPVPRGRTA